MSVSGVAELGLSSTVTSDDVMKMMMMLMMMMMMNGYGNGLAIEISWVRLSAITFM